VKETDVSQYNNYILHNSFNTMLKKSSVFMMVLLVAAASLIGISSIYQALPVATAQSQQQTQITKYLEGKLLSFLIYSSSDGKACYAYARISEGTTRLYPPNSPLPLGLKPADQIVLLVPDQTMCVLLGQVYIAKLEVQFRVALPPLTIKALPPTIQDNFPPNQRLYRIVWVSPSLNIQ
jgi:hypothetical protein